SDERAPGGGSPCSRCSPNSKSSYPPRGRWGLQGTRPSVRPPVGRVRRQKGPGLRRPSVPHRALSQRACRLRLVRAPPARDLAGRRVRPYLRALLGLGCPASLGRPSAPAVPGRLGLPWGPASRHLPSVL